MADKVNFELVSPERILVSEPVDMVVVPGSEGNFGVLPGHAPLISSVRPGVIDVYEGNSIAERIFIAGGFAEVTPERCTVLADAAINVAELDRAAVEQELGELGSRLAALRDAADRGSDEERAELRIAERRHLVAQAKLDAIGHTSAH
jgi:F-type H+-transporting ATPase subunit epsilon